jgi:Rha family phage regulatory protein|nr:MAG TPA: regulatory protein [Caudoviricetes sp.]
MNNLVIMHDKQVVTTSLKVAEIFGKEHKHVMETVRKLTAENSTVRKMFIEDSYLNSRNQQQPMYYMNRDGFTLLAMGFTGSKAMEFKLKYIEAFNKMEQIVRQELPQTPEEKLALTMQVTLRLDKRVGKLEKSIDEIQNKSEIDSDQRYKLGVARNKKAVKALGGKGSNAYKDKALSRKTFRALEHSLKKKFVISRYEDLKKENFDKAKNFISNWYPPFELKEEIELRNAQENLF